MLQPKRNDAPQLSQLSAPPTGKAMKPATHKFLLLVLSFTFALAACNGSERKSQKVEGSEKEDPNPQPQEDSQIPSTPEGEPGVSPAAISPGEAKKGKVLNPPSMVLQREGAIPNSTERAEGGGFGALPGHSWVFDDDSAGGSFLIAAASTPNTVGGDVLRRVDLAGEAHEHDFNAHLEGVQGLHIMVPPNMRQAIDGEGNVVKWGGLKSTQDFGGDGIFTGTICGLIPGPDRRVIALATYGAFVLDPYVEEQSVVPDTVIIFPYSNRACDGEYSKEWGKLFAIDVTKTQGSAGQKGVYVVDIPGDKGFTAIASLYLTTAVPDYGFNTHSKNAFQDLILFDDVLYLISGNARFESEWDTGVHRVPLNKDGEPLFSQATLARAENPIERAQGCTINPDNTAGAVVFGEEIPILLTGGTQAVVAWDISQDPPQRIDLDQTRPGIQGLDLVPYGQGAPAMRLSPDGSQAFIMPHCRSRSAKAEIGGSYANVHELRVAAFDLKDGTPTLIPGGLDAGFVDFMRKLAKTLKPSYLPKFKMSFRDLAVGPKYLGIIGAGSAGASGLGPGSDLVIIDVEKKGPIAFAKPTDPRKAHELDYGLDLGKDDPDYGGLEQSSQAIIWIP